MELLRYQRFLAIAVAFGAVWWSVLSTAAVSSLPPSSIQSLLIRYAPVWAVLSLGVYAVGCVGYGLMNFKDTPEAAAEIERQIVEAKTEMTKRGIITTAAKD